MNPFAVSVDDQDHDGTYHDGRSDDGQAYTGRLWLTLAHGLTGLNTWLTGDVLLACGR